MPKVLLTGAGGFIGRNLSAQLPDRLGVSVIPYGRESSAEELDRALGEADIVCHLAGVNRPDDDAEFERVNSGFTSTLCGRLAAAGRAIPILFASSIQAARDNPYGRSKLAAEQVLIEYANRTGAAVHLFRLPNVFGKWARPNYNSAIATFCHNTVRGLPIRIDDPDRVLQIVYIDDVVNAFARVIAGERTAGVFRDVEPVYQTTVAAVAAQIQAFRASRDSLVSERVGTGLIRALHATYVSYLPPQDFAYSVPAHRDARGVFVEMLKTQDSGQFSFFTAHPGITRGGHYHHSKTEKFLVLKGHARFRFRHIVSGDVHEILTSGEAPVVVEMVPGWTHDVTNVGDDEMIVMLWANEIFDRQRPDTFVCPI